MSGFLLSPFSILNDQRKIRTGTDVVIAVNNCNETFAAHRCVLMANSGLFARELTNPAAKFITLNGAEPAIVILALDVLYGMEMKCSKLSVTELVDLFHLLSTLEVTVIQKIDTDGYRHPLASLSHTVSELLYDKCSDFNELFAAYTALFGTDLDDHIIGLLAASDISKVDYTTFPLWLAKRLILNHIYQADKLVQEIVQARDSSDCWDKEADGARDEFGALPEFGRGLMREPYDHKSEVTKLKFSPRRFETKTELEAV